MLFENNSDDLITFDELCTRLMISETTAYRLLRSGEIEAFKLGSHWKIPSDAVKNSLISIENSETLKVTLPGTSQLNKEAALQFVSVVP